MPGVTRSDVERFFHQSRARRQKPADPDQEHLNQVVIARVRREQFEREQEAAEIERAAELDAYERSVGGG